MTVERLHHMGLVTSDAQRTADFLTGALGLRLLKQTVEPDDPAKRLLYFGNAEGSPGSILSYTEWPGAEAGHEGIGGTHHFALLVEDREGLLRWKRRLVDLGLRVSGPLDRHYFESIYLRDPDGAVIEIATRGAGWTRDEEPDRIGTEHRPPPAEMLKDNRDRERIQAETWPEPVPVITDGMRLRHGMHHVTAIGADIERTHDFLHGVLGMRRVKRTSNFDMPDSYHWYWGVGEGAPGTVVTYFERSPERERQVAIGPGQAHHYAVAVDGEASLDEWREKLLEAGLPVSPTMDRTYFRSVRTRDPDGQVVELATAAPGFTVDEPEEALGTRLCLPPRLESRRDEIERALGPLRAPEWREEVAS
jgi:glyoxalase family protein